MPRRKRRKDGLYQKVFRYNGKQYAVYGKTEAELTRKYNLKMESLKSGGAKEACELPFSVYAEIWLDEFKNKCKPATNIHYRNTIKVVSDIMLRKYGIRFGDLQMGEAEYKHIISLQNELLDPNNGGRTANTTNQYTTLVKEIFSQAVKCGDIERNPCQEVKSLKIHRKAGKTIHRALTKEETELFLEGASESWYLPLYKFMLNTGLRVGEAGALTACDIDYKKNEIRVSRTLTKDNANNRVIGTTPKTDNGERLVPLFGEAKKALNLQKQQREMLIGNVVPFDGVLFTTMEGKLLHNGRINRDIERCCKRAGIERFSTHALRATFATRMVEAGIKPNALKKILGHSDIKLTFNVYVHCDEATIQEEISRIDLAI
jgi:integrase